MARIEERYPRLRVSGSHVDWEGVSPVLLNLVDNIMQHAGRTATISSGRRSEAYNKSIGGAPRSKHVRGLAIDASVEGVPIARSVPPSIWNRYGIRTGDQPGFFRGQRDPIHVDIPLDTEWGSHLVRHIISGSQEEGVEPEAVLAVASVEGGFLGRVGDQGTSFGPWQLHIGGAMPSGKGGSWANGTAGVDYALQRIGDVAQGMRGEQAIRSIVTRFERPADPETEIERATARYRAIKASGNGRNPQKWIDLTIPGTDYRIPTPDLPGIPNPLPGAKDAVTGAFGAPIAFFNAIKNFFLKLIWPLTHPKRAAQIVAGGFIVMIGLWMLAKGTSAGQSAQQMLMFIPGAQAGKIGSMAGRSTKLAAKPPRSTMKGHAKA